MFENKMEDLLKTIEESNEYQEYQKFNSILEKDPKVNSLINEIKLLEQKATKLEYLGNMEYKEIDNLISKKKEELESIPVYQEYLNKMEELNDILSTSTNMIEEYLNEKI